MSKNLTLSYKNVIFQIQTKRAAYTMRNAQVEVRETSSGEITIEYKGRTPEHTVYREQEQHQGKVVPARGLGPLSHPWRHFNYYEKSTQARERRGELCILCK